MSDNLFEDFSLEFGPFFKEFISLNRYKICIETGVALGTTTRYICEGAYKNNGHVFAFDIWDKHGINNSFGKLSDKLQVESYLLSKGIKNFTLIKINTKSNDFEKYIKDNILKIDFAFIDGDHSYQGVKNDFDKIYPYLSNLGSIIFHDTFRIDGCREFLIDLKTKYNDGTFDIIDIPYGNLNRRVGISILMKQTLIASSLKIDEISGSISSPADIYYKENLYIQSKLLKVL